MRVTVFAGGYGGARFLAGMRDVPDTEVTAVVNTADDLVLHGLTVCPDLDTVMYTLGGGLDTDRGWGRADEGFRAGEELRAYGMPQPWFGLGDRDLATHLVRTQMLAAGYRLTDVTAALCRRWEPGVTVLPMSDDRVETHVVVADGDGRRAMHFQEWWVRHGARLPAEEFVQVGGAAARPTDEVAAAIAAADLIAVAPSNPVVSIGPILGVPGLREAVAAAAAPVVGVSPIIAGRAVRGMAEQCLAAVGVPASAAGVARHYGARSDGGLLDAWLVAPEDAAAVADLADLDLAVRAVPLLMSDPASATALARAVLAAP